MADTNFIDGVTVVQASWLNDVNDAIYRALGSGGVAPTTPTEVATNIGAVTASSIHAGSSVSTPDDADELPILDSTSTFSLKKITWASIKSTLKTYFDTLYQAAGSYVTTSNIGSTVQAYDADIPTVAASQAEMETGTEVNLRSMSPLRIAQAIAALGSAGTDQVARDQIALTNIRLMLNSAITTGALVQGKQWELATDEWGATSTGETYSAPGSLGYYSNPNVNSKLSGATGTAGGTMTAGGGLAAAFDGTEINRTYTSCARLAGAGAWAAQVGKDWGSGNTKKIIRFDFWGSSDDYLTYSSANPNIRLMGGNSGIGVSGTVLWSGQAPANTNNVAQSITTGIDVSTAYRYHWLEITGGGSSVNIAQLVFYEQAAAPDITLIPDASVTVSAAPAYMDAYFLWKDDSGSAVLGTDLTVELSRDGGTTYTTATLTNLASYDGTYSIVRARASVSSQPSGTSMLCRIKTLNNKAQRVAAPALYAE